MKAFPGNEDNESPVINVFPDTIEAKYIKVRPINWKKRISLRLEILGCYHPYGKFCLVSFEKFTTTE